MFRPWAFLLMTMLLWATASVATAQYSWTTVEHNWTFSVGGHQYGLIQQVTMPTEYRMTIVCLGTLNFNTEWLAIEVVLMLATILVAGAVAVARISTRKKRQDPSRQKRN